MRCPVLSSIGTEDDNRQHNIVIIDFQGLFKIKILRLSLKIKLKIKIKLKSKIKILKLIVFIYKI